MCSNLKDKIKISIIVPVYKVPERYLRKCIESLIDQNLEEYEIILVDDGSPDNCGSICDEYKKSSNKIQVIHKKNAGVSVARNCGLDLAIGEYIMFVDGDDAILENTLDDIWGILEMNNADISLFKYFKSGEKVLERGSKKVTIVDREKIYNIKKGIMTKEEMFKDMCIASPWGKVFKADFIKKNNIRYTPGIVKAQDRVFMMNCLQYNCAVQCVDYMYYYYNTENEMSICRKYNENIFVNLLNTGNKIEKMVDVKEFRYEINQMYEKFFVEVVVLNIFHKDNKKSFAENVILLKNVAENEKFSCALKVCNLKEYGNFFSLFIFLTKHKWYRIGVFLGKIRFKIR